MTSLEVLFAPAEFAALAQRRLSGTFCVVFDILRATSSMVTALGNGATAILPVETIEHALEARKRQPNVLLVGEREGVRIGPELANGTSFDLGNSPREFSRPVVQGRTIVMTTTNGTRALRACHQAQRTLAGSFLNLSATATAIREAQAPEVLLVCSGTLEETAYEDVLGAGALCDAIWAFYQPGKVADSAAIARDLFLQARGDLSRAIAKSRNARRLLSMPELRDDVAFCLQTDVQPIVADLGRDGLVRVRGTRLDLS